MNRRLRSGNFRFILSCSLLLFSLLAVRPASAHFGDVEIIMQGSDIPLGPYSLSVWTYPDTMEPGPLDVIVSIEDPVSKRPILDCEVFIAAIQKETDQQLTPVVVPVGTDPADRFRYETSIILPEFGVYELTVIATDSDGETAQVSFPIVVKSLLYFRIALSVLMLISSLATVWFLYEGFVSLRRKVSF